MIAVVGAGSGAVSSPSSLQRLATLSLEKRMITIELLIARALCLSPSVSLSRGVVRAVLSLIQLYHDLFKHSLTIIEKMDVLAKLEQGPLPRLKGSVTVSTLCNIPSNVELYSCTCFVRSTLMSIPSIPVPTMHLYESTFMHPMSAILFNHGANSWIPSAIEDLIQKKMPCLSASLPLPSKRNSPSAMRLKALKRLRR